MEAGCYDVNARVKDMDTAGILRQTLFPSFPRFCGQVFKEAKDKELALLCVQAWNDFIIEDWCGAAPGRFIPLAIVPLWDPHLAASEARRAIGNGARGIIFSENPADLGLPSIHNRDRHWDPLFEVANETGLPICTHIGSSSKLPMTASDAPAIISLSLTPLNAIRTLHDYIFSGLFFRFPRLKLALSEGEIGWIPFVLMWMDHNVETLRWTEDGDYDLDLAAGIYARKASSEKVVDRGRPPSQIFRDHVYGCFIDDPVGIRLIDLIGVGNVMLETDYPHGDGSWPDSLAVAQRQLKDFSDEDRSRIMIDNACELFQFTPAEAPL